MRNSPSSKLASYAIIAVLLLGIGYGVYQLADSDEPEERTRQSGGREVRIQNKVTSGADGTVEDDQPLKVFTSPKLCSTEECALGGKTYDTGDTLNVVCQTQGDRLTNGNDESDVDDRNPELAESTRWYGVRTKDNEKDLAYFNEVWTEKRSRGGLGLPACDH